MKALIIFPLLLVVSCKTASDKEAVSSELEVGGQKLEQCAAIRGNGQYLFSHFGALARFTEEFGAFQATVGGSSTSITSFIYESLLMNPGLKGLDTETYNRRC
jgi:hypothetical protein